MIVRVRKTLYDCYGRSQGLNNTYVSVRTNRKWQNNMENSKRRRMN